MRLFIRHRQDGEIVSVAKVDHMPDGVEHPYAGLAEDEAVVEVDPDADVEQLAAHEIGERFTLDIEARSLRVRGGDSPSRPPGRSRRRPADG
jgi:hypothetical protein